MASGPFFKDTLPDFFDVIDLTFCPIHPMDFEIAPRLAPFVPIAQCSYLLCVQL
jgi:hypothetical protein